MIHAKLHNYSWLIGAALNRSNPRTVFTNRTTNNIEEGAGGLAIVLRGGAFRGSGDAVKRHAAQVECSQSIERHLIRPLVRHGLRAHVFLTVYDADVSRSTPSATDLSAPEDRLAALQRPFAQHVRAITYLDAKASEQLTSAVAALDALLLYCSIRGEHYHAVLLTRFDMRFKISAVRLLGVETASADAASADAASAEAAPGRPRATIRMDGIRFLWHEVGPAWRFGWSPSIEQRAKASTAQLAEWAKLTGGMVNARDRVFRNGWKATLRTADTLHAFGFAFLKCFRAAVAYEMTRGFAISREIRGVLAPPRTRTPTVATPPPPPAPYDQAWMNAKLLERFPKSEQCCGTRICPRRGACLEPVFKPVAAANNNNDDDNDNPAAQLSRC